MTLSPDNSDVAIQLINIVETLAEPSLLNPKILSNDIVRCKISTETGPGSWMTLTVTDDEQVVITIHDVVDKTVPPLSAQARLVRHHVMALTSETEMPFLTQFIASDIEAAIKGQRTVGDVLHFAALSSNCFSNDSVAGIDPSDGEVFIRACANAVSAESVSRSIKSVLQHAYFLVALANVAQNTLQPIPDEFVPGGAEPNESEPEQEANDPANASSAQSEWL